MPIKVRVWLMERRVWPITVRGWAGGALSIRVRELSGPGWPKPIEVRDVGVTPLWQPMNFVCQGWGGSAEALGPQGA